MVCVFQKICFKVKVLKALKISSDSHVKTCRFLKRRAILITIFLEEPMLFLLALKSIFLCYHKNQFNFAVNLAEMLKEATIHFSLFDESDFSLICDNGMYKT